MKACKRSKREPEIKLLLKAHRVPGITGVVELWPRDRREGDEVILLLYTEEQLEIINANKEEGERGNLRPKGQN